MNSLTKSANDKDENDKDQRYKGVLFDLDGTLLDTANDLGETLNAILVRYDLPTVAREKYRPVASDGAKGLLELGFGKALANYDYEQLRAEFLTHYRAHIAGHTCLYPGIVELIQLLDKQGVAWGIVTNKPIGLTKELLPHFTALNSAASILGGDSLPQRKPHPAPLLRAAEEIGVAARQCIYVGDAPRDITAGNAANMMTAIAAWGYIPDSANTACWQADLICQHPHEVGQLISLQEV